MSEPERERRHTESNERNEQKKIAKTLSALAFFDGASIF